MTTWPREVLLRVPRQQADCGSGSDGIRWLSVDEDGTVWGYEPLDGTYTRHHGLSVEQEDEARRAAQREALIV